MTAGAAFRLWFVAASELLATIVAGTSPADGQMDRYFRAHPDLGKRDRGEIADLVYFCLRRLSSLQRKAGSDEARRVVSAALIARGADPREIERVLGHRLPSSSPQSPADEARSDFPQWFWDSLGDTLTLDEQVALAQHLRESAPLDLRVNTVKAERASVQEALAALGYSTEAGRYAPTALRAKAHFPVFRTAAFREGWLEVQDEGSQLVAAAMAPKRRECVVDFCAGAGGKTLALGALMANTGMLYAFDTQAARLARARERVRRAGLHNVRFQVLDQGGDRRLGRLAGKADRVLVDAPCSGSGTWRRNPDLKWRLAAADLARLAVTQGQILDEASHLVRTGGHLLYATCSVLPAENEAVIADFLGRHPEFAVSSLADFHVRYQIAHTPGQPYLTLAPHRHGVDGFFAAMLIRGGGPRPAATPKD